MARKAALGLACLAIALGLVGCTWTSTRQEYPPSIDREAPAFGHQHGHSHGHDHGAE